MRIKVIGIQARIRELQRKTSQDARVKGNTDRKQTAVTNIITQKFNMTCSVIAAVDAVFAVSSS